MCFEIARFLWKYLTFFNNLYLFTIVTNISNILMRLKEKALPDGCIVFLSF